MTWRYIAQRLTGDGAGEFLDWDLPLTDVQVTTVLSGPNRLSGTISPEIARLKAPDGRPLLEEWGTTIWAEEDNVIRGGGILVPSEFDGPSWNVECIGLTGYAKGMPYTDSWYGVEIDPLDIVRHIWNHLQTQPRGNLGLIVDNTKSDVLIGDVLEEVTFETGLGETVNFEAGPYKLAWWLTDDLGQNIDDLAAETPFDYAEYTHWTTDGPLDRQLHHHLKLGYPRLGRRRDDLRFAIGENIDIIPTVGRDASEWADEVLYLGAGEGREKVRGRASVASDRLRRVRSISDPDAKTTREANKRAAAELAFLQGRDEVVDITVADHPHAPIGSWTEGDEVHLIGSTGWIDLDVWVRVVSTTINPSESGASLSVMRSDPV